MNMYNNLIPREGSSANRMARATAVFVNSVLPKKESSRGDGVRRV